jgi:hypothetical protein
MRFPQRSMGAEVFLNLRLRALADAPLSGHVPSLPALRYAKSTPATVAYCAPLLSARPGFP